MKRILLAAAATLLGLGTAQAVTLIDVTNPNSLPAETAIILNNGSGTNGTGSIGTGGGTVNFTTDVSSSFTRSNETIAPSSILNPLRSVTLSTHDAGITFTDFSFKVSGLGPISVEAWNGGSDLGGATLQDFLLIDDLLLSSGGAMDKIVITGNFFGEVENIALSGVSAVPLPPAGLLFGTALAGRGVLGRRRKKRA